MSEYRDRAELRFFSGSRFRIFGLCLAIAGSYPTQAMIGSHLDSGNISADHREGFAIGPHSGLGQIIDSQFDDSHNIGSVLIKCSSLRFDHHFVPFFGAWCLMGGELVNNFDVAQGVTAPRDGINKFGRVRELYCAVLSSCKADSSINELNGAALVVASEQSEGNVVPFQSQGGELFDGFKLFFSRISPSKRKLHKQVFECSFVTDARKDSTGSCVRVIGDTERLEVNPRSASASKYEFVAKCEDFTVVITIGSIGEHLSTISGNNKITLHPSSKNDAAIGFNLSDCVQVEEKQREGKENNAFHLAILSTDSSSSNLSPTGVQSMGARLLISRDGERWYEIALVH